MARVALIQMVSGADFAQNLSCALRLMQDAAAQGAQLLLLPENFALLDSGNLRRFAETEVEAVVQQLCAFAARHGVWIVAGSLPLVRDEQGSVLDAPRVRSSCLVIDALGAICARYDKIHLFDVDVGDAQGRYCESDYVAGGRQLRVIDTPVGCVGLSICYDLRFAEQYQRLTEMGADLIVVPSAFTYVTGAAHWEVLLRARAIENQVYILGANQGGVHSESRRTWGHSMVVDPWGEVVAGCGEGEAVVLADIDLERLQDLRRRMPVQQHRQRAIF